MSKQRRPAKLFLTERARKDIATIRKYSIENWGKKTAERYIDDFAAAGADWLTVHVEASPHLHRTLQAIRGAGMKAGVSLNPHTPLATIEHVLGDLDLVLLMSVNPGFGGQSYIPSTLAKVQALRSMIDATEGPSPLISVDGGVKPGTIEPLVEAGIDVAVAGSAIFGQPDYAQAISRMRAAFGSSDLKSH